MLFTMTTIGEYLKFLPHASLGHYSGMITVLNFKFKGVGER